MQPDTLEYLLHHIAIQRAEIKSQIKPLIAKVKREFICDIYPTYKRENRWKLFKGLNEHPERLTIKSVLWLIDNGISIEEIRNIKPNE